MEKIWTDEKLVEHLNVQITNYKLLVIFISASTCLFTGYLIYFCMNIAIFLRHYLFFCIYF